MARLRFLSDVEGLNSIELLERTITIGRDENNTIAIADPGISKHHALLIRDGHEYKLFDLHSANGTWLNGERITTVKLKDGDVARFGHLELSYETGPVKKTTAGIRKPAPAQLPAMAGAAATPAPTKPRPGFGAPTPTLKSDSPPGESPKKLPPPSDQPVVAPKKLAAPSDQPTIAPKKLTGEPGATPAPRIKLKRD